jgi:light-regulated signal transduction histidine kinase (bacteriophytochrome)
MVQDITEVRRAQEELERTNTRLMRANRELEEFAFVVSHDLKEPLRMVNLYAQMLLRRPGVRDDTSAAAYAGFIEGGVKRAEELIRDLLAYSRMIHEHPGEPSAHVDLNEVLAQALDCLSAQIEMSGSSVTSDSLPQVRGEPTHLGQVFQNLLSNALKYRRPTEPLRVRIRAQREGEQWLISITDNGIGFRPKYADRIFGLFKRLHRDEYPGTGLGLAICRRIIERHDGRIWAASEGPDCGATFSFTLPAIRGD